MPPLHGSRQAGLSVILSPCHHLLPRSRNINSHSLITATIPPRHLHSRLTSPSTSKYRQQHQFLIQNHNSPRPFSTTPPSPPSNPTPTPLTPEKYHTLSDAYIDALVTQLEELQEQREDVDVEYSVRLPFPIPIPPFTLPHSPISLPLPTSPTNKQQSRPAS